MDYQLLEINLISAQSLKKPSSPPANLRPMQTYTVAWVDPTAKLRTRVDRIGAENPTWNDKFIFRVPSAFLDPSSSSSSAVCLEIYAVGHLLDTLIGTVRLLVGDLRLSTTCPSFAALQIRRPSGRFQGILNVGAMLLRGDLRVAMAGNSAIGYRDLMGENRTLPRCRRNHRRSVALGKNGGDSLEEEANSKEPLTLSEWNGRGERSRGILSRLGFQKKIHLSPSDQDLQISFQSNERRSR